MLKKEKYHGEVWLPETEGQKCFCILTFKNNEILLETNLVSNEIHYKHQTILGVFTELGYLTFLDCLVKSTSSGLTSHATYLPQYSFMHPDHFVDPQTLLFKKFSISNDELAIWRQQKFDIDWSNKTLKFDTKENHSFRIETVKSAIDLIFSVSYTLGQDEFRSKIQGSVKFNPETPVKVIKAIDIYYTFQKLIQFLSGQTRQFNHFNFQCEGCESWGSLYFQDDNYKDNRSLYFTTNYNEILPALPKLLETIFNDESFSFCVTKLLDNHVSGKQSHSKRFTNSISCLEAYGKRFGKYAKPTLKQLLKDNSEFILKMTGVTHENLDDFVSKIIRSRDYHVHSNIKNQNICSDFELLYISILLDIIVGIRLLQEVNVSQIIIDKIIEKGRSVYMDTQAVNKILGYDYLRNN